MRKKFIELITTLAYLIYVCGGIATFGHAFEYHAKGPIDIKISTSLFAGIGWPLFWSWHLQSKSVEAEINARHRYIT